MPLVSVGVEFAFFLFTLLVLITFRRKETNDCIVPLCLDSKSFDCNLSGWHHSITAKSMGFGAGHTWLLDYTCHLLSDNRQIRPSVLPSLKMETFSQLFRIVVKSEVIYSSPSSLHP